MPIALDGIRTCISGILRHVARVLERGVTFCPGGGGSVGAPPENFKFKVANTPKFNDFLQLPKKFWMSKYLLLTTEVPDLLQAGRSQRRSSMH